MYYPIQIPFILNKTLLQHIQHSEEIIESIQNFVICYWEIQPLSNKEIAINDVVIIDGCIDLVANYQSKQIGFVGMSKTIFSEHINFPTRFLGARLKPGAFHQLTKLHAKSAMDTFLPLEVVDSSFDTCYFWSLPHNEAKEYFRKYLQKLIGSESPNEFTALFDVLSENMPTTVTEIYQRLFLTPRTCQRIFLKHFGITPQKVLSVLRFQKCLDILLSNPKNSNEVLEATNYYDQPHLIKDFKRNIGITPLELMRRYKY